MDSEQVDQNLMASFRMTEPEVAEKKENKRISVKPNLSIMIPADAQGTEYNPNFRTPQHDPEDINYRGGYK